MYARQTLSPVLVAMSAHSGTRDEAKPVSSQSATRYDSIVLQPRMSASDWAPQAVWVCPSVPLCTNNAWSKLMLFPQTVGPLIWRSHFLAEMKLGVFAVDQDGSAHEEWDLLVLLCMWLFLSFFV